MRNRAMTFFHAPTWMIQSKLEVTLVMLHMHVTSSGVTLQYSLEAALALISCSDLVKGASIGTDSCLESNACKSSEAIIVRNDSCVGDGSCSNTKGFTQIDSFSCIGVNACAGLTLGTISVSACQGVGACSRPVSMQSLTPTQSPTDDTLKRPRFTVGSDSCNGCYAVSLDIIAIELSGN